MIKLQERSADESRTLQMPDDHHRNRKSDRASEKIGYTISGLSRMIASIEKELGLSLLIRSRDGVRPTPECEALLPSLKNFILSGEICLQTAAAIGGGAIGTVKIGMAYSALYRPMVQVIGKFHKKYPKVKTEIINGNSSELMKSLTAREIDLCVISQREGACLWHPLFNDPLLAWIPEDHPLAQGDSAPIESLEGAAYIDIFPGLDSDNKRLFDRYHINPDIRFTTYDSRAAQAMVASGLGCALNNALNTPKPGNGLAVLPLDPPQTVAIGIASAKSPTPATETFLKFLLADTADFSEDR